MKVEIETFQVKVLGTPTVEIPDWLKIQPDTFTSFVMKVRMLRNLTNMNPIEASYYWRVCVETLQTMIHMSVLPNSETANTFSLQKLKSPHKELILLSIRPEIKVEEMYAFLMYHFPTINMVEDLKKFKSLIQSPTEVLVQRLAVITVARPAPPIIWIGDLEVEVSIQNGNFDLLYQKRDRKMRNYQLQEYLDFTPSYSALIDKEGLSTNLNDELSYVNDKTWTYMSRETLVQVIEKSGLNLNAF